MRQSVRAPIQHVRRSCLGEWYMELPWIFGGERLTSCKLTRPFYNLRRRQISHLNHPQHKDCAPVTRSPPTAAVRRPAGPGRSLSGSPPRVPGAARRLVLSSPGLPNTSRHQHDHHFQFMLKLFHQGNWRPMDCETSFLTKHYLTLSMPLH